MQDHSINYEYHSLDHVVTVAEAAEDLCDAMGLNETDTLEVLLAAWFHDVGFTEALENHEKIGCLHARVFLQEERIREEHIRSIERLISATEIGYTPLGVQEMIMRDADLHYLGEENFEKIGNHLRKEWEMIQKKFYSDTEWLELNLTFLNNHTYHTPAAKAFYNAQKEKNKEQLESRLRALQPS